MTMTYKSPEIGQEISCVMKGIQKELLLNNDKLKLILKQVLKKNKFTILKSIYKAFSSQGFTALILLAESHLAIHTYPEYNSIYFNLYSCRGPKDAEATFNLVKKQLNPKEVLFYKENQIPIVS